MAQWITISMIALAWIVTTAVLWGKMSARMDFMKSEIQDLQSNSQTPAERDALAKLVHTELDAHAAEDFQKFKAIDDRMVLLVTSWDRKLDMILQAVKNGR